MRSVLSISMPLFEKQEVVKRAKKANKTVSSYILDALGLIDDMISEEELLSRSKRAFYNYKTGKANELKSLDDLMG